MVEGYAFVAAFMVQILTMSVLYPAWFVRWLRVTSQREPAERLAQLYPGVDLNHVQERFLTRYRALAAGIALLGLLLLGWLINYMQRADWDDGRVEMLVTAYFMAQNLPLVLVIWHTVTFNKAFKRMVPQGKRTAVLQRRGLFDFVSPFAVTVAVLSYLLFAAFVVYIQRHPFPGFVGAFNLVCVTLVYALNAFVIYRMLYGKKNPLETHAGRLHTMGLAVKSSVYSCIAVVVYLTLNFSLGLLDLQRWEPFALSVFFVVCALLASMGVVGSLRAPTDELNSSPAS